MNKIQCIGGELDGQFVEDTGYYCECIKQSHITISPYYFDNLYYNMVIYNK